MLSYDKILFVVKNLLMSGGLSLVLSIFFIKDYLETNKIPISISSAVTLAPGVFTWVSFLIIMIALFHNLAMPMLLPPFMDKRNSILNDKVLSKDGYKFICIMATQSIIFLASFVLVACLSEYIDFLKNILLGASLIILAPMVIFLIILKCWCKKQFKDQDAKPFYIQCLAYVFLQEFGLLMILTSFVWPIIGSSWLLFLVLLFFWGVLPSIIPIFVMTFIINKIKSENKETTLTDKSNDSNIKENINPRAPIIVLVVLLMFLVPALIPQVGSRILEPFFEVRPLHTSSCAILYKKPDSINIFEKDLVSYKIEGTENMIIPLKFDDIYFVRPINNKFDFPYFIVASDVARIKTCPNSES